MTNPRPDDPVSLLRALIACPSVTPRDAGALDVLDDALATLGFTVTRRTFADTGTPDVENLFATIGEGGPHLVFAGHTDVVPPGDETAWSRPPFSGEVVDGEIYGRGAVDMKGGLACFVAAAARYLARNDRPQCRLSLLITGDEEGPAVNGTVKLLAWAQEHGHAFDAALVGEPTSVATLGDTIKIGRRGSLSGRLTATGRQGHVAYPHHADNPVPRLVAALAALTALKLDEGTAAFERSNLEVTGLATDSAASNVIPGQATADFNVRFNDTWTLESLKSHLAGAVSSAVAEGVGIAWIGAASAAFRTSDEALFGSLAAAIGDVTGARPEASTGGGTSDARFIHRYCPVVEFGLVGTTMHRIDERAPVDDVMALTDIYERFLIRFFGR